MSPHRTTRPLSLVMIGSLAFASAACARHSDTASPPAATTRTRSSLEIAPVPVARHAPTRASDAHPTLPAIGAYNEYHNPHAGFSVRYPAILTTGPAPHVNNGITFRNGDSFVLTITASPDLYRDQTNEEQLRMAMDRRGTDGTTQIAERRALADGYVASGVHGPRVFYERRLRTAGRVVTLTFDYDPALRDSIAPVIDEVVRSVRVDPVRGDVD